MNRALKSFEDRQFFVMSITTVPHVDTTLDGAFWCMKEPDIASEVTFGCRNEIEVKVVGPVEIEGAARPFSRAWTRDLVVYLSLHPRGVSSDEWMTALWPDRRMAPPTVYSTISAARRSLGKSKNGKDHLPWAHGRLRLSPTVGTDWDYLRFVASSTDPGLWKQGLELIRGRPFEGLDSPDWPIFEGIAVEMEDLIVDLALRLGQHYLNCLDSRLAIWAARQGLRVSKYDERLYRILLQAMDLIGNPAAIEATMIELIQLLGGKVNYKKFTPIRPLSREECSIVHPETAQVYRRLSRYGYRMSEW